MRAPLGFDTTLHIRVEPELREALADVARKERTTPSEVARRGLRALLASRPSTYSDDRLHERPGSSQPVAA